MSLRTPRPAIVSTNSGPTRKSARMFEPPCRSFGSTSHRWPGWTAPIGSAATSADNTLVPVVDTVAGSSWRGFRPTACATSARSVRSYSVGAFGDATRILLIQPAASRRSRVRRKVRADKPVKRASSACATST